MIRWCAYCQKYLGEIPPFEDFALTHGVCPQCKVGAAAITAHQARDLRGLAQYYAQLRDATRRSLDHATDLLDQGLALGLAPRDLMMGMLQPALYDMGRRWATGECGVGDEERLTALSSTVIELAFARRPEFTRLRQSSSPAALLMVAEENAHTLGARVVEYGLLDLGLPIYTVMPGLSAGATAELVRALRPRVLGVSVSMREQLPALHALSSELRSRDEEPPVLVAGGYAFRTESDAAGTGFRVLSRPSGIHELAAGDAAHAPAPPFG